MIKGCSCLFMVALLMSDIIGLQWSIIKFVWRFEFSAIFLMDTIFFEQYMDFAMFSISSSFGRQLRQTPGWVVWEHYMQNHITELPCLIWYEDSNWMLQAQEDNLSSLISRTVSDIDVYSLTEERRQNIQILMLLFLNDFGWLRKNKKFFLIFIVKF